ncbi:UNVERIFIED_CONTAM: hypothetical protein Sradi_6854900 [Sesamum radiatum]|uniref:Reverse transcriptase domain-containing protein n=1 Tax=Sesamum radiatum TaxID=300843 RepID=A0AAW2JK69_SESRA
MQRCLHLLIDSSQTAFVPGRSISDNVLLAQELLAGYNRARLPARCTIKVDFQKAYDSVAWDFLLEGLKLFNFPSQFRYLVRTVHYYRLLFYFFEWCCSWFLPRGPRASAGGPNLPLLVCYCDGTMACLAESPSTYAS